MELTRANEMIDERIDQNGMRSQILQQLSGYRYWLFLLGL